MTVGEFFDMVSLNEYHNIRLKDDETDKVVEEFSNGVADAYFNKVIKGIATDWIERVYILWI